MRKVKTLNKEDIVCEVLLKFFPLQEIRQHHRIDLPYRYKTISKRKSSHFFIKKKCIIVDFFISKIKLAIEVDGIGHCNTNARNRDKVRDRTLANNGFTILRLPHDIGFKEGVIQALSKVKKEV